MKIKRYDYRSQFERFEDFMTEMSAALVDLGIDGARVHTEIFGAAPSQTPGIAAKATRPPHPPPGAPGTSRRNRPWVSVSVCATTPPAVDTADAMAASHSA